MKNLYIISLLIISGSTYAQGNLENANWIFGNRAWLNFNNGILVSPPASTTYGTSVTNFTPPPNYSSFEGVASVSDEDGRLLFFTDGKRVYNLNGNNETEIIDWNSAADELAGNTSSAQGVLIIPRPNRNGEYYLISLTGYSSNVLPAVTTRSLHWSLLNLNVGVNQINPLNQVMSDSTTLPTTVFNNAFNNRSEAMTSCIANDGINMWLIVHMQNSTYSRVLSYLVTENGISATPSDSFEFTPVGGFGSGSTSLKVSPDTTRIALKPGLTNPLLGTFNNLTGDIDFNTNPVGTGTSGYSLEFSNNSQILFYTKNLPAPTVVAVDVNNPSVESLVIDGSGNGNFFRTIQRGLDRNIYLTRSGQAVVIQIDNPASFEDWHVSDITLNTNQSPDAGLPQWIWSTCKQTLTLTNANNVNGTNSRRERSQWIRATNTIAASTNTNVIYHAGNFIELSPGFEARHGARASAYIDGCTQNFVYKNGSGNETQTTEHSENIRKSFIISPNPAKNFIDLTINNHTFNKIIIAGIDGKIVLDKTIEPTGSYNLDISRYASGVYIVNVVSNDGKQYSQKLIKN